MEHLFFPGLGLGIDLERVAFTVLGHPIYWYGIIIAVGFLFAVWFCSGKAERFGVRSDDLIDMLFFAAPLGILGARLYYIIFYLDLYRRADGTLDISAMLRITDGGLAIYGGIIAAAIVLFIFCKIKKLSFLAMADLGVHGLLIGQCIGRWGNFVNIEAYGGVTTLPWRMCGEKIAGELYGKGLVDADGYYAIVEGTIGVHPTFFYESLWNLIGFLLLLLVLKKGRRFDGQALSFYLIWYGAGRFFIEGLRTDSLYLFGTGLRVSQVIALTSALAGLILLIWRDRKKKGQPLPVEERNMEKEEEGRVDHP